MSTLAPAAVAGDFGVAFDASSARAGGRVQTSGGFASAAKPRFGDDAVAVLGRFSGEATAFDRISTARVALGAIVGPTRVARVTSRATARDARRSIIATWRATSPRRRVLSGGRLAVAREDACASPPSVCDARFKRRRTTHGRSSGSSATHRREPPRAHSRALPHAPTRPRAVLGVRSPWGCSDPARRRRSSPRRGFR